MQGPWHASVRHCSLQPTLPRWWNASEEVARTYFTSLTVVFLKPQDTRRKAETSHFVGNKSSIAALSPPIRNIQLCLFLLILSGPLSTSSFPDGAVRDKRTRHSSFAAPLVLGLGCWCWLRLLSERWHFMYHFHLNSCLQPSQSPEMKSDFSRWT